LRPIQLIISIVLVIFQLPPALAGGNKSQYEWALAKLFIVISPIYQLFAIWLKPRKYFFLFSSS